MNAKLRKEIRFVLPIVAACVLVMWAAALISVGCLALTGDGFREPLIPIANGAFLLGCLLVGVRPFCAEFQHGTMSLMLMQPISRWEQWATKRQVQIHGLVMLSTAFIVATFAINRDIWAGSFERSFLGFEQSEAFPLLAFPIAAYLTCPLWALHLRGTIGAAAISVMSPMVASVPLLIWAAIMGKEPAPWISIVAALSYVVVCHHLGKRYFFRMQVAGGRAGDIDLAEKILRLLGPVRVRSERMRQSSVWALFKKELCLQQAPVLLCLLMLFVFGIMFLLDTIFPPTSSSWPYEYVVKYTAVLAFYVFLVPLVSACIAMTEERASGIHSWQITLPVSRTRQWLIKLAGLMCTNLILAALIPGVLLLVFPSLLNEVAYSVRNVREFLRFSSGFLASNALLMIISLYVAGLCRNTITAILAALAAIVYLIVVFIAGPYVAHLANPESTGHLWVLLSTVAPIIMAILLLYLSRVNFGQAEMSNTMRLRQIFAVCSFLVVLAFALGGVIFGVPDSLFGFIGR